MAGHRSAAATVALSLLSAASATACPIHIPPTLADARKADAVVVGYVTKDVRETSPERKAAIERWLASDPDVSRKERRAARRATDRARLTVAIDHVIAGSAPSTATVFWYRMTNNGPPAHVSGGYVFALHKVPSPSSTTEPPVFAVMQGICTDALVFRRGSPQANAIREMYGLWPEPLEAEPYPPPRRPQDPAISWPAAVMYALLAIGAAAIGLIALWPKRRGA